MNIDSFIEGFELPGDACRDRCSCGREFFDNFNDAWDWDPGEIEALQKDPEATALDHSVSRVEVQGSWAVTNCDCWRDKAKTVMAFLDEHAGAIAKYFAAEKYRLQARADEVPVIELPEAGYAGE